MYLHFFTSNNEVKGGCHNGWSNFLLHIKIRKKVYKQKDKKL